MSARNKDGELVRGNDYLRGFSDGVASAKNKRATTNTFDDAKVQKMTQEQPEHGKERASRRRKEPKSTT